MKYDDTEDYIIQKSSEDATSENKIRGDHHFDGTHIFEDKNRRNEFCCFCAIHFLKMFMQLKFGFLWNLSSAAYTFISVKRSVEKAPKGKVLFENRALPEISLSIKTKPRAPALQSNISTWDAVQNNILTWGDAVHTHLHLTGATMLPAKM